MDKRAWKKVESYDSKQICEFGRFAAMTWEFGSIYQCKVFIQYDHIIEGKKYINPGFNDNIGIGLTPGKTREEAAQRALDWIDTFQKKGILSSNKLFKKVQKNYPSLFPTRESILEQWFITGGSGYEWLDGCIIETSPSDHLGLKAMRKKDNEFQEIIDRARESAKEARALLGIPEPVEEEEDTYDSFKKKVWAGDKIAFYPVSKDYANLCQVPDDVQTHWLKLAFEAAILLRDKSGIPDIKSKHNKYDEKDARQQERNCQIGVEVVAELERRFPNVLKKIQ